MSTLTRPQRPPATAGGWRRRAVGALLVGAVVSAGVAIGVGVSGSVGSPESLPAPVSGSDASGAVSIDWVELVADLDLARDLALRNGNPAAIANYAATGSPAAAADEALLQQVRSASLRPSPVLPELSDVEALDVGADEVRLRVSDRLSAVSWIGADGVAAATQEPRDLTAWLVRLRWEGARWLLWEVSAEAEGAR